MLTAINRHGYANASHESCIALEACQLLYTVDCGIFSVSEIHSRSAYSRGDWGRAIVDFKGVSLRYQRLLGGADPIF